MRIGVIKDKNLRNRVFSKGEIYLLNNCIKKNVFLPIAWRSYALSKLKYASFFFSQVHNYCIYSYRSRGVLREFKMSRHVFKMHASNGLIPGFKKASW